MNSPRVFEGGCHCGNIAARFTSFKPVEELQVRACQCSFCRKHGVRTITDSNGTLEIRIRGTNTITKYTFGLGTSDFLVCKNCGVYVAAVLEHGDRCVATLNVNILDNNPFGDTPPEPVSYSSEDFETRQARRLGQWTPTSIGHNVHSSRRKRPPA